MSDPAGPELPGVSSDEGPERIVCHVDMDCFYAACERLKDPDLRGEPVVVGMGYEPGETVGAVATASYEAREYGVESAQGISEALDRLPRRADDPGDPDAAFYRPVDMEYYQSVGSEVKDILHDVADTVREVSIDEAYLDVTDRTAWEVAEGFARHVKQRIDREVGVTASVGVAPNMSTAKIASDHDKPDGLVVVPPGEVREFLAPIPVEEVHGVGPVTASELRELGVETAGDLAGADPAELDSRFGDRGRELYRRARGDDDREVEPVGRPKSLSRESAFSEATADGEAKRQRVEALAADVAERAGRKGALYRTIGVKVVTPPYDVNTRERSLPGPVDDPDLLEAVALDLLEEFADDRVRKLGVRVSNLDFAAADQVSLDGWSGDESTDGAAGTTGGTAASDDPPGRGDAADGNDGPATLDDWVDDGGVGNRESDPDTAADGGSDGGDGGGTGSTPGVEPLPPGQTTLADFR